MAFTRKPSPEREVKLGKEFPAHMPEVNDRTALNRWWEDVKNLLQGTIQRIEDALSNLAALNLATTITALRDRITALENANQVTADPSRWLVYDKDVAPEAAVLESKLALNYATHSNANDPTQKEKQALAGTYGVPSGSNRYVTNSDPRLLSQALPVGMMIEFGGTTPPADWMDCDGAELSRADYAALFSAIGTTHGVGNGTTTFNIPDARGRTLIGAGTGTGLTARSVGDILGEETHLLTGAESGLPAHFHEFDWRDSTSGSGMDNDTGTTPVSPTTTVETSTAGPLDATDPHNLLQPSLVVMILIKYK